MLASFLGKGGFFIKKQYYLLKGIIKKSRISPLLILAGLSLIAAVVLSFYPRNIFQNSEIKKNIILKKLIKVSPAQSVVSSPEISAVQKAVVSQTPSISPTQGLNISQAVKQTNPQQTSLPSLTSAPTPLPTQAQKPTVNLQITEPDGTSSFSVTLNPGNNLCDNLTEAKSEGKIKSVTLDYSYMSTFHSAYVRELNGYTNNWTVTVNGKTPQGCSLYNPNNGDNIVWKFG